MLIVIFVQRGAQGVTISLSAGVCQKKQNKKGDKGIREKGLDTARGMYDLEKKVLSEKTPKPNCISGFLLHLLSPVFDGKSKGFHRTCILCFVITIFFLPVRRGAGEGLSSESRPACAGQPRTRDAARRSLLQTTIRRHGSSKSSNHQ